MSGVDAGWQPDPTGRHQHRYWDGTSWTDQVSDDGVVGSDPVDGPPAGAGAPAPGVGASPAASPGAPAAGNKVPLIIGAVLLVALVGAGIWFLTKDDDGSGPGGSGGSAVTAFFRQNGMSEEESACMAEQLDGRISAERLQRLTELDEPDAAAMSDAMLLLQAAGTCNAGGLGGELPTVGGGGGFGTDGATLSRLRDACGDGDMSACDDLYWSTPVGSDDEEFGATCGGRTEWNAGRCTTIAG